MDKVIQSFLVGLGFDIDDASLKKFNKAISDATLKVTALYGSVQAMAAGVFYGISQISSSFEEIGYQFRIIAPAINKALVLRNEMLKAYAAAGINLTKVIQQSIKFNMSLAKTKFALDAIYKSVGAKFLPLLTKQMDIFRQKIYANMPRIQAALEKFVTFVFKAFDATVQLGTRVWSILQRVYDFFYMLHKATDGWSTVILAAVAAWRFLNLAFLATPLGMLIAGLTALLLLWDDFKTFQEGGKSLINWGSDMTRVIVGLVAAIGAIGAVVYGSILAFKAWGLATEVITTAMEFFNGVLSITDALALVLEAPIWAIVAAIGALVGALTLADAKWNLLGGHLSGFFSGIGGKIMDFLGGGNVANNVQNSPVAGSNAAPLGSNVSNSNKNMNVNQQTNINVMGAADAGAVGKSVAGEQGRVNFDMTRNMKAATF